MTRRLWLCAILIITLIMAMPALAARRRTVTPGDPDHCVHTTLARFFTSAQNLAVDEQHVYVADDFGTIIRLPKLGGGIELLVFSLGDWTPLSMTIDATNIYLGVMARNGFFTKEPGAILTVPKSGGVPTVLVENVRTPFAIAADATHIYWAAAGTIDFAAQRIESDGKIERALKDGSNRQALAEDLSGPLALAIDANTVFYSETGIADDDPTVGLYRIPKNGGTAAELADEIGAILLAVDGNTVVLFGGNETEGGIVAIEKDGATPMRVLYAGNETSDETAGGAIRIADRRAYFVLQRDGGDAGELAWVSIDAPNGLVVVREGLYFEDDFALDGCAAIVSTIEGQLIRTGR
jgi:hypothetical protein